MRIGDLLSLLSQKLNLENNRASCKDGLGGREAFCILPWFRPFFTLSPLCLREEDIDSRSDKDKISQSSSLFFCREEVTLVSNPMLLVCSPPLPAAWEVTELAAGCIFTNDCFSPPSPLPASLLSFFFQHDQ